MTTMESGPARNEAAPHYMTRPSPDGSAGTTHHTSAAAVIEAADRCAYQRMLARTLDTTTYRGIGIDDRPYYSHDDDPTGRRIYLTRRGLRRVVGHHVHALVLDRLARDLAAHAGELQNRIDAETVRWLAAGRGDDATGLQAEIAVVVVAGTVDRACDAGDDADDAETHHHTLRHNLTGEVEQSMRRHPAGHRPITTGGQR